MKCLQKLYSSPSWLVVSLCLLCTLFLTMISTNSVSALSDYTETISTTSGTFLSGCNLSCIQQYHYLILRWTPVSSNNFIALKANFYHDGITKSAPLYVNPFYNGELIIDITSISSAFVWDGTPPLLSSLQLTATLTESYTVNPSGSLSITENGTFDVTNYAEAVVDVPMEVVPGDYHDDLVNLKQAIILVPAVCLVIYFFYAIYKMIMGGVRR